MSDLPRGWTLVQLGKLGDWRGGGTPSKAVESFWANGTIPWISPKDMKRSLIEDSIDHLNTSALGAPGAKRVPAGSLLIVTRSGILQHSLPVAIAGREVAINQDLKALIPNEGVNSTFVALQLRARAKEVLRATVQSGTTVESINFSKLKSFEVRIPPLEEQLRIVEKLQPLLNRCLSVRVELGRISALVLRQRRATLLACFREGPGSSRFHQSGLMPQWPQVPLRSLLAEPPANGISPPTDKNAKGAFSLKLTATTSGILRLDEAAIKRVHFVPDPSSKYWLRPGDLLVQRANALEHVGAAAIFEGEENKFIYPDLMIRARIDDQLTRRYVWRYLNSPTARKYFQDHATGTSGNMPKITGSVLSNLSIPLPPRPEMQMIVDKLERLTKRLDMVQIENRRCEKLVSSLENAFLAKAVSGKLVKQIAEQLQNNRLPGPTGNPIRSSEKVAKTIDHLPEGMQVNTVPQYIEHRLIAWPKQGLTFEELRADAPGTYEELKAFVFELLSNKRLAQRYDKREQKMKLMRAQ